VANVAEWALKLASVVTKATHSGTVLVLAATLLLILAPQLFVSVWRRCLGPALTPQLDDAGEASLAQSPARALQHWLACAVRPVSSVWSWATRRSSVEIDAGLLRAVEDADRAGVELISFVPTTREVGQLLRRAAVAEIDRAGGKRSRCPFTPDHRHLRAPPQPALPLFRLRLLSLLPLPQVLATPPPVPLTGTATHAPHPLHHSQLMSTQPPTPTAQTVIPPSSRPCVYTHCIHH
jgi:hypothetical protein